MNLFSLRRQTPSLDDLAFETQESNVADGLNAERLMPSVERPRQVFVRGQGRQQAFTAALEQAHIEVLFELANLLGECRLGD